MEQPKGSFPAGRRWCAAVLLLLFVFTASFTLPDILHGHAHEAGSGPEDCGRCLIASTPWAEVPEPLQIASACLGAVLPVPSGPEISLLDPLGHLFPARAPPFLG